MLSAPLGWIARLSIGQKLAVSFGLIILLLIGSFAATLVYLSRVNGYVDRHQRITVPAVVTASEMLRNIGDMQLAMHHVLEHQTENDRTANLQTVADIERRTLTALDTYQATHAARTHPVLYGMLQDHGRADLAEQEDRAIVEIADGLTALLAQREEIETSTHNTPAIAESAYEQATIRTTDAITLLVEIHRKIDVEMKIEGDRLVNQARLIGVGVAGLLGLLIAAVYVMMQRYVAVPLMRLAATADRIAHHDFTAQFGSWPGKDEVGALAASLATMLTSLRERGTALMRKTKELEAFTYSIAHDLKGPLREIEGFSSLLEKQFAESGDQQKKHQIVVIRTSSLRLTHMIDALLKYSRLEQQELPRTRFNVVEMINSLLADRQHQSSGVQASITIDLPFADLYGEPISIRQAITNLLDNAIKFSRHTSAPVIAIGGQQTATERIIWVRDNGIGFDAANQKKIFGLFERLHSPSEYEGTGVGLAIVKMVVEKHGGRVWAESAPGQGSTFFLAFPDGQESVSLQLSASTLRQD
jgi:signal transduction histidine kinase